ncbi:MAG: hypothetical protein KDH99_05635 [Alcanivoracaceae bacterium]|nr:hypothetical protein [Alcanivoracaceae bacterium]
MTCLTTLHAPEQRIAVMPDTRTDTPASTRPALLALVAGFAVALAISLLTGENSAQASPFYYVIGLPLLCVAVGMISYRFPQEAGRWTVFLALGQCLASLLTDGVGGALATLLFMMVLSLPPFITAVWLSRLSLRQQARRASQQD